LAAAQVVPAAAAAAAESALLLPPSLDAELVLLWGVVSEDREVEIGDDVSRSVTITGVNADLELEMSLAAVGLELTRGLRGCSLCTFVVRC
jgi:hypothetical protein